MRRTPRKNQKSKSSGRQTVRPSAQQKPEESSNLSSNVNTPSTDIRADGSSSNPPIENTNDNEITINTEPQTDLMVDINQPSTSASSEIHNVLVNDPSNIANNNPEIEIEPRINNQSSENPPPNETPLQNAFVEPSNASDTPPKPKVVAEYIYSTKLAAQDRHPNADIIHVLLIPKGDEKRLKLPASKRILHTFDIEIDPNYKPCHNLKRIPFPTFPNDDSCSSQESSSDSTNIPGPSGLSGSLSRPAVSTPVDLSLLVQRNISRAGRNRRVLQSSRESSNHRVVNPNLPSTSHEVFSAPQNSSLSDTNKKKRYDRRPPLSSSEPNIVPSSVQESSDTSEAMSPPQDDRLSVNILYKKKKPDSRRSLLTDIINRPTLRNQTVSTSDSSLQGASCSNTGVASASNSNTHHDSLNSDYPSASSNDVDNVDVEQLTASNELVANSTNSPRQEASQKASFCDSSGSVITSTRNRNAESLTSTESNGVNEAVGNNLRNEPMSNTEAPLAQGSSSTSESSVSVERSNVGVSKRKQKSGSHRPTVSTSFDNESVERNQPKSNTNSSLDQASSSNSDVASFPSGNGKSTGSPNKKKKSGGNCSSNKNVNVDSSSKSKSTGTANTTPQQRSTSDVTSSIVRSKRRKSECPSCSCNVKNQTNESSSLGQGTSSSSQVSLPSVKTRETKKKSVNSKNKKRGTKKK